MLALVPLIYFLSDLAEDLPPGLDAAAGQCGPATIGALKTLTAIKLGSVIASMVSDGGLLSWLWLYRALSGTFGLDTSSAETALSAY